MNKTLLIACFFLLVCLVTSQDTASNNLTGNASITSESFEQNRSNCFAINCLQLIADCENDAVCNSTFNANEQNDDCEDEDFLCQSGFWNSTLNSSIYSELISCNIGCIFQSLNTTQADAFDNLIEQICGNQQSNCLSDNICAQVLNGTTNCTNVDFACQTDSLLVMNQSQPAQNLRNCYLTTFITVFNSSW